MNKVAGLDFIMPNQNICIFVLKKSVAGVKNPLIGFGPDARVKRER
jgi:hypothetical protein